MSLLPAPRRLFAPSFVLMSLLAALPASAQFNGGWVAYQNPNAPPYVPGSLYDWTGFTWTTTQVAANGVSTTSTGHPYASSSSIASSNVGGNTNQSVSYSTSGVATYEWLWSPTGSNITAPPPSMYVLARVSGGLSLAPNAVGRTAGLGGKALLSFAGSASAYTFGSLAPVTQYKVMPASGGKISSVAISPALSGTLSGSTPTGDVGYTSYLVSTGAFPIVLSSPDPMGRPDLGDGKNQYVYDSQQPEGYLTVPATANAVGASSADTAWLSPHVSLSVSPAMQTGAQPFQWLSAGSQMYVYALGSYPSGSSYPGAAFIYKGLPPNNTYFGNHLMTMNVDGVASQTANYQLFFNGAASNWPGSDGVTPNWYHYYQQAAPASILYDPVLSAGGSCTMGYLFNHNTKQYIITGNILTMGSSAARYSPVPAFEVGASGLIRTAGTVKIKGILSYLYVYGHELGHLAAYTQHVQVPYIDGTPPAGIVDSDGDGVPDTWEIAHHLDPEDPDTAKYYTRTGGVDNGKGDAENLASMTGLGRVVQYSNLWQQDWADLGVQYGKRPSYVPFEYDPLDLSQIPSNSIPSTVLTDWP